MNNHSEFAARNDGGRSSPPHDQTLAFSAHDLCNHLQVISGAFRMIQWTVGDEASASVAFILDGARSSLEQACRLSRQIVDGGGAEGPVEEPVSIAERMEALRQTVLLVAGPAISVEYLVSEDIPEILCNADALDNALLNIVGNAARAMPRGGRILISLIQEYSPTDEAVSVVLRVADTGCGMPAEVAKRAFELGFTTRKSGTGSGIGLAMVAAFARSAGGSAELETSPDVGTVVTVRLPGVPRHVRLAGAKGSR